MCEVHSSTLSQLTASSLYLYCVVEHLGRRMDLEVVHGCDDRLTPAVFWCPVYLQHVVSKMVAKQQVGEIRLWWRIRCLCDAEISMLSN